MSSAGARADVCVVGAGIIGLSIGYHLARAGVGDVVVLDRVGVGAGATAVQPGGVRQQWGSRANCLLARESLHFYREAGEHLLLAGRARLDEGGYLFVAALAETLAQLEANRAVQNACGVPSVALSPDEIAELVPGLDPASLLGAVYCSEDGYFDRPQAVVAGFAETAERMGVRIEQCDVTAVTPDGLGWKLDGRGGETFTCEHAVVAAGCDAVPLLAALGIIAPVTPEERHLFYSTPILDRLLEPLVVSPDHHFAAKHLADGSVLASDLSAVGDEASIPVWLERVRAGIATLLPILEYVSFPVHVGGNYDVTPDRQPILGPVPDHPGLWVAVGLNGRGFMMAPAIGRLLAEAIALDRDDELLAPFSIERFEHGETPLETQVV